MSQRVPPTKSSPPQPTATRPPIANRLLSGLMPEDVRGISPHLRQVELSHDQILFGRGDRIHTVFFLENALASATLTGEDGNTVEVGTVGHEGAVGLSAWTGLSDSPTAVICQVPGTAQAMELTALAREAAVRPAFAALLHRSIQVLAIQSMHSAACNASHSLEQRLARWLLTVQDRVRSDELPLTQEFLSYMLGVYRPSVTVVARTLQGAGLITYERGRITIRDRDALETTSCECYWAVRRATDALTASRPGSRIPPQDEQ